MGIEYKISGKLPASFDSKKFLTNLNNPRDKNGWSAFEVSSEGDGFYFCDNCWSEEATKAFRKIIDEVLRVSGSVTIGEC